MPETAVEDAPQTDIPQSPFCRELRSKKYYFRQGMPIEEAHILDPSNHCWCRLTMQAIGPDGGLVKPKHCTGERTCYRSLFAEE